MRRSLSLRIAAICCSSAGDVVFDKVVYPAVFCSFVSLWILTLGYSKDLWSVYRTMVRIKAPERTLAAYSYGSHGGVVVARDSGRTK